MGWVLKISGKSWEGQISKIAGKRSVSWVYQGGFGWRQSCLGKAGWISVDIKDLWEELAGVDTKDL